MTHLRLWKFEVPTGTEERFIEAYRPDGPWGLLFATAPGFIRTELWRAGDGAYLTADYWNSLEDYERFQTSHGDDYRRLDSQLEGISGNETFVGAFELAA
jgi:heme-degrading monooxygenase HmoA